MNAYAVLMIVFALAALVAAMWAMRERVRAATAEAKLDMLAGQGEMVRAEAAQSAGAVAEALVRQTEETFRNREHLAQLRIEEQLKPVAETLAKFQEHVAAVEKIRTEETGGLKEQIASLLMASTATQDEARKLSTALRRGAGVQGRWGEQTLRNVLEAAGLANRYDFDEQPSLDTEEGRKRPDVTVRLPGGAVFVIDAKCSLNAFLDLQDAIDEAARDGHGQRHVQSLKSHVAGLSAREYWKQFEPSPDFVVMFVPLDSALAAALDRSPDLMNEAMDRRVVIATPSTLFALCKAVSYGWRVEEQAANARLVADHARELYKRISVMGSHAAGLGKALETAAGRYNQFVGSLETQVLTQARRFKDLKVDHQGRDIEELTPVGTAIRPLAKLSSAETPPVRLVAGGDDPSA